MSVFFKIRVCILFFDHLHNTTCVLCFHTHLQLIRLLSFFSCRQSHINHRNSSSRKLQPRQLYSATASPKNWPLTIWQVFWDAHICPKSHLDRRHSCSHTNIVVSEEQLFFLCSLFSQTPFVNSASVSGTNPASE